MEGLADYLWDGHRLQLFKKVFIWTALNLDAENATIHLKSLLAGDFWKVVNRAKFEHATDETIADCTCMEGHLRWMEDFGPWITCSAMFRNVKYKPEQARFFQTFMPVLIQELPAVEPRMADFNSKVSALTQLNKNLQYFLVENKQTMAYMIELGHVGCAARALQPCSSGVK